VATTDTRSASESEYQEILRRLAQLEKQPPPPPPQIPLIDPTANVLKLVEQANIRQDDLRAAAKTRRDDLDTLERYYQDKLREAESKRLDAERSQEQTRVDSLLDAQQKAADLVAAKLSDTATTLAQQVVATAEQLSKAAAGQNETTTQAIRLLERNQYLAGVDPNQRNASRQINQWAVGLIVGVVVVVAEIALRLSGH